MTMTRRLLAMLPFVGAAFGQTQITEAQKRGPAGFTGLRAYVKGRARVVALDPSVEFYNDADGVLRVRAIAKGGGYLREDLTWPANTIHFTVPAPFSQLLVFRDGSLLREGADYTVTGQLVSFEPLVAERLEPQAGTLITGLYAPLQV